MRTLLCRSCLCFVTADNRHALSAMRDHALDEHAHIAEVWCIDVDTMFWSLIGEAFGAKARR